MTLTYGPESSHASTPGLADGVGGERSWKPRARPSHKTEGSMTQTSTQTHRRRWEAALSAYLSARSAYDDFEAITRAEYREVLAKAPPAVVEPSLHYGIGLRWRSASDLEEDVLLTQVEKLELRPVVESCKAALESYYNRPTAREEDETSERLYDAVCDAEQRLLQTPAPDLDALIVKKELFHRELDDDKFGFDDLGRAAADLDSYLAERLRILEFADLLRLAGRDHPILRLEPFSPNDWTQRFETAGGCVSSSSSGLLLVPAPHGDGCLGGPLLAELEATPWKYRAIDVTADSRRGQGGDPLFSASGDRRPAGAWKYGPTVPLRRVVRVIFTRKGGVPVPVVQTWKRDGARLVMTDTGPAAA